MGGCSTTTISCESVSELRNPPSFYTRRPSCPTGTVNVTRTGTAGGTYSSTAGLSLDPATGQNNLGTNTPHTYVVNYSFTSDEGTANGRLHCYAEPHIRTPPTECAAANFARRAR